MTFRLVIIGLLAIMTVTFKVNGQSVDSVHVITEDSLVYDLFVSDLGYDSWLNTYAKPANFYSNEYYQQWNILYVNEWNNRVTSGVKPMLYDNIIYYEREASYPLDLNYKLYNYFLFFEDTYKEKLLNR